MRATAQYDAAAALIGLKDWDGAARSLEDFRQRFPNHPLQADVGASSRWPTSKRAVARAAGEFERMAGDQKRPAARSRAALWQAAELHEKGAGKGGAGVRQRPRPTSATLQQYPQPLEPAIEARCAAGALAKADGNASARARAA